MHCHQWIWHWCSPKGDNPRLWRHVCHMPGPLASAVYPAGTYCVQFNECICRIPVSLSPDPNQTPYCNQCCGAATFFGGSGSWWRRSRSRLRLQPTWVGSGSTPLIAIIWCFILCSIISLWYVTSRRSSSTVHSSRWSSPSSPTNCRTHTFASLGRWQSWPTTCSRVRLKCYILVKSVLRIRIRTEPQ